jgi:hypothetical protein
MSAITASDTTIAASIQPDGEEGTIGAVLDNERNLDRRKLSLHRRHRIESDDALRRPRTDALIEKYRARPLCRSELKPTPVRQMLM